MSSAVDTSVDSDGFTRARIKPAKIIVYTSANSKVTRYLSAFI
jgi:hypothetical protein